MGLISQFKNDVVLVGEVSEFEPDELHEDGEAKQKDNALRLALTHLAGEFGRVYVVIAAVFQLMKGSCNINRLVEA